MNIKDNDTSNDSEPTPQQRDSVLTPEQTPSWSWGIALGLIVLGSLIVFAGFYYGIINV